ncbi:MAG: hypothetical protein JWM41_3264 [Gemmatimonadetes bacterium]|nr:hypothetical protein [Gemmatimonadota bacterium]
MQRTSNAPRVDHLVITHDQMVESRFNTVYDAVEALHGNWLQTRGADSFSSPSQVRVYLDNSLLGGITTLRDIASNSVTYVQYFDGVSATGRWGLGHGAGVIYVSSHPKGTDPQGEERRVE